MEAESLLRRQNSFLMASSVLAALGIAAIPTSTALAWCQMTSLNARPSTDEPCILASNHPGSVPLAWRRRCTAFGLSSELPSPDLSESAVRDVLSRAFGAWQQVSCDGQSTGLSVTLEPEFNRCTEAGHFPAGGNINSIMFVTSGWATERAQDPNAYAVTFVWHNTETGEIVDVDMEMNEQRGPYAVCPDSGCAPGQVDLLNVVTHETGHYFGLAHSPDDQNATMWASAPPGELIKRTLETDDAAGLCAIYPPGALGPSCSTTPRGGRDLSCNGQRTCSCSAPGAGPRDNTMLGWLGLSLSGVLVWVARQRKQKRR